MDKKHLSVLIIVTVLIASAFFVWNSGSKGDRNEETAKSNAVPSEQVADQKKDFDPVSLQAIAQKEFKGSNFTVGEKLEENTSYTRYFISYISEGLKISGIMNVPKGVVPQGGFPVLFLNHGYIDPAVYTNGRGLRREQDYFAKQGFVVIHSDYRNHAQSDKDPNAEAGLRLGYVEDVLNAIAAVKNSNLEYLSKEKFGMLGHSMGGGVAQSIMVTKPGLVQAYVMYAPVSSDYRDSFNKWIAGDRTRAAIAQQIIEAFGAPQDDPEFWDNVSPRTFFENVADPVQYHHGTADQDVPLSWSEDSVARLQDLQKNAELFTYSGQPHEFTASWFTFMERSTSFFREQLK
jgi:uncharacterized protein